MQRGSDRSLSACVGYGLSIRESKTSASQVFWLRGIYTHHVLLSPVLSGFPLGLLMTAGKISLFGLQTLLFEDLNRKYEVKFLTNKILKTSA